MGIDRDRPQIEPGNSFRKQANECRDSCNGSVFSVKFCRSSWTCSRGYTDLARRIFAQKLQRDTNKARLPAALRRPLGDALLGDASEEAKNVCSHAGGSLHDQNLARPEQRSRQARVDLCHAIRHLPCHAHPRFQEKNERRRSS